MNKDLYVKIFGVLVVLILIIWFYIRIVNLFNKREEILLRKIDNLELKINSLQFKKDSLRTVIDSTHIKIITNEKHYQEKVNTIISQPTSADFLFIREYIRQYRNQNNISNIP